MWDCSNYLQAIQVEKAQLNQTQKKTLEGQIFNVKKTQKPIYTEKETHFQFQVCKWGMVVDP